MRALRLGTRTIVAAAARCGAARSVASLAAAWISQRNVCFESASPPIADKPAHRVKRRDGRVEDGRGSLGQFGNAPFPIPAHRTGRARLRHPALRLASP